MPSGAKIGKVFKEKMRKNLAVRAGLTIWQTEQMAGASSFWRPRA